MGKVLDFTPKMNIMQEVETAILAIDRLHRASVDLGRELAQRGQHGEKLTKAENDFLLATTEYALLVQGFGGLK